MDEKKEALRLPFLFAPAQVAQGLRYIFLVQLFCEEMQKKEVQIEQGAQAEGGNHRTDADLPAEQEADDDYDDFDRSAAQADRVPGLTRQRDHERIARARAERAFHVHPGAEYEQFEPDQQHQDAAGQSVHLRDPAQREQTVNEHSAQDNVDDCTKAEALAA